MRFLICSFYPFSPTFPVFCPSLLTLLPRLDCMAHPYSSPAWVPRSRVPSPFIVLTRQTLHVDSTPFSAYSTLVSKELSTVGERHNHADCAVVNLGSQISQGTRRCLPTLDTSLTLPEDSSWLHSSPTLLSHSLLVPASCCLR